MHAACAARRAAWSADVEAGDVVMRGAEDGRHAVDAQGRMDAAVLGRVEESQRRAADAVRESARAFCRSAVLFEAAASEQVRAYRACRRAGNAERAAAMRGMAARSQGLARAAARLEAESIRGSGILLGHADSVADMRSAADGNVWGGDLDALSRSHADMCEGIKEARQESEARVDNARASERQAAKARRLAAAAARAAADAAAAAAAAADAGDNGRGKGDPEAERAAAAWRKAMAAADRADAEAGDESRSGGGNGGN